MLATCAEVEYYINFGEQTESFTTGGISSFAVGNFNMNFGNNNNGSIPQISNRTRRYLFLAGLSYRGVNIK